jgi:hypothetical protein
MRCILEYGTLICRCGQIPPPVAGATDLDMAVLMASAALSPMPPRAGRTEMIGESLLEPHKLLSPTSGLWWVLDQPSFAPCVQVSCCWFLLVMQKVWTTRYSCLHMRQVFQTAGVDVWFLCLFVCFRLFVCFFIRVFLFRDAFPVYVCSPQQCEAEAIISRPPTGLSSTSTASPSSSASLFPDDWTVVAGPVPHPMTLGRGMRATTNFHFQTHAQPFKSNSSCDDVATAHEALKLTRWQLASLQEVRVLVVQRVAQRNTD